MRGVDPVNSSSHPGRERSMPETSSSKREKGFSSLLRTGTGSAAAARSTVVMSSTRNGWRKLLMG
jgi:hypothetical protein